MNFFCAGHGRLFDLQAMWRLHWRVDTHSGPLDTGQWLLASFEVLESFLGAGIQGPGVGRAVM